MNKNNTTKLSKGSATCVQFSPREYKRIKKKSGRSGKSIPQLLRNSYFSQPPRRVIMNEKDVAFLRKDLNQIGNNLNQVAKRLNAGWLHGWMQPLELVLEQFKELNDHIYYSYGVPKN